jgi:hypothetical protein
MINFDGLSLVVEDFWSTRGLDKNLLSYLHSFEWLYHLREFGGAAARRLARSMDGNPL